jgi:two-component system, sensor histidine kinase and response regulator
MNHEIVQESGATLSKSAKAENTENFGTMERALAHKLNNILTPILMSAGLIRFATRPEEVEKHLAIIENSAVSCADLIKKSSAPSQPAQAERKALNGSHRSKPGNLQVLQRPAAAPSPSESRTVLVIDDDTQVLTSIQGALQSRNFAIILAENGSEGLRLARSERPDLVISDVHMASGDGYSVLESLRADPATRTIPFILMTGRAGFPGMRRGMDLGADDYLTKPFSMGELFAAVEARFQRQAALREHAETTLADLRVKLSLMLPHELNTPLTGILATGEMLQFKARELAPADLIEVGEGLLESGCRLQRLIQKFLLFSETELLLRTHAHPLLREGRSFAVQTAVDSAARQAARRHARPEDLELDIPEGASAVLNPELMFKIVDELADNAFKFSTAGSVVRVSGQMDEDILEISITDHGRGMKREEIAAVGPYVQFNREEHEQQGTGLGLIIAKRIVELHGGTLSIRSKPGSQTRVSVRVRAVGSRG